MRLGLAGAVLLSAAAYYVYLPLPSGVSEPWKLMLLDALFRSFMQASDVAHAMGVCHRVHVLNRVVSWVEVIEARSSPAVNVTDSALGGVPTRVFHPIGGEKLKRGVIYFHGGGWALCSGRMRSYDHLCRKMAEDLDAVIMSLKTLCHSSIKQSCDSLAGDSLKQMANAAAVLAHSIITAVS
uniref:Neutral cholesterol ester hydrolase 1-like n=1 Tax=Neolamprologus brichardi TaxID=32507 RepID=A0A3Q4HF53_NEOBR